MGLLKVYKTPISKEEAYEKWETATKMLKLLKAAGHITHSQLISSQELATSLK